QNAVSEGPWTLPAISSIMTGVSPLVHLATEVRSAFPKGLPVLAEYMRKDGYKTAGIGHNPHLVDRFYRGFQFYRFFPQPRPIGVGEFVIRRTFPRWRKVDHSTAALTTKAIRWINTNRKRDFFMWLHYFDPHMPYTPPGSFLPERKPSPRIGKKYQHSVIHTLRAGLFVPTTSEREWIKELYLSEVQYVDDQIGRLMNELKKKQIYDRSLIILTSDHGEEFWEHGGFEHAHTVYNELLRVPLIIKLPEFSHKGRMEPLVPTSAILPTLLDLCGIRSGPHAFSSSSLVSLWNFDDPLFKEEPVISTGQLYFDKKFSLQFNGMKYIRNHVTNREELYDLRSDPSEQVSFAGHDPEKLEEMRSFLREKQRGALGLQSRYHIQGPVQIELTPADLEMLRSLGYVQ
ncbi:sulfatase, partial [bacterium]|nr:sulfatase [bacterium]